MNPATVRAGLRALRVAYDAATADLVQVQQKKSPRPKGKDWDAIPDAKRFMDEADVYAKAIRFLEQRRSDEQ